MKKIALAFLLWPALLSGQQDALAPSAVVLGAASDAALCGLDVLDMNPAALAASCGSPVAGVRALFPPTLSAGGFSDGPHADLWTHRSDFLDGLDNGLDFSAIPAEDRRAMVEDIPEAGWASDAYLTIPLLAVRRGGLALSATKTFHVGGTLPRDAAELLLEGWDGARTGYDISTFDLSVLGVSTYTLGYGRALASGLSVGASASLYTGTANGSYHAGPVRIDWENEQAVLPIIGGFAGGRVLSGSIFDFRPPDGIGYGVDVGARYDRGGLTTSFAVENVVSGMSWPERTVRITTFVQASTETVGTEVVRDTFDTAVPETSELRTSLESYEPARRIRSAVAYTLPFATVAYGRVDETGTGRLFATGDGWDLGLALRPLGFLEVQGSLGEWRGARTLGGGVTLRLSSFLIQGGIKDSELGRQGAVSIGITR